MASGSAIKISILADAGPAKKAIDDIAETSAPKLKRSMDEVGESTDQAATKTGIFASALGAFAGGLDAVGLGKYAAAVQGGAVAVDVFSNASDVATLALQSKYVALLRDKVATIASTVAEKAAAIGTKAFAAAQWLLNAALDANPIGLVIIAVGALVAAFVIAYKKSATFRAIVQGAFAGVKAAAQAVGRFFTQTLPHWWDAAIAAGARLLLWFRALPGRILSAIGNLGNLLKNAAGRLIQGFIDGIKSKFNDVKKWLGTLTSFLPSWKGPAARDRRLLRPAGQMIVGGLVAGMADKAPAVQSFLSGLTGQIAGGVTVGASARSAFAAGGPVSGGVTYVLNLQSYNSTPEAGRQLIAMIQKAEMQYGERWRKT